METVKIRAIERQALGTRASRRLREQGLLPAIIYSREGSPKAVALPAHEVDVSLQHSSHLLRLDVDGQEDQYLIKDVQFDHLGSKLIHLDLARVNVHEVVEVKVPIELSEGGVLDQVMLDLPVRCRVTDIPDSIRPNVAGLKLGQTLCVRDLELPAGVEAVPGGDEAVAAVRALMEEVAPAAAEAEGPAEPEVIGREKKEGEEEQEEES
jgi:large subunit ribosomal protein L25